MRKIVLGSLAALAACSPPDAANNGAAPVPAGNVATAATPAPPTADQKAALAVAQAYMTAVSKGDFATAHKLWDGNGAASRGSVADLKRSYAGFSSYEGRADEVDAVSAASGQPHVVVSASATVVSKKTGEKRDIAGFIYLRRPSNTADWRIWGVDVRRRPRD